MLKSKTEFYQGYRVTAGDLELNATIEKINNRWNLSIDFDFRQTIESFETKKECLAWLESDPKRAIHD
mgnify:CR=1 FL=1